MTWKQVPAGQILGRLGITEIVRTLGQAAVNELRPASLFLSQIGQVHLPQYMDLTPFSSTKYSKAARECRNPKFGVR